MKVSPGIEYLVNVKAGSVYVTLINNNGVTKAPRSKPVIEVSQGRTVSVSYQGKSRVSSVTDIKNHQALVAKNGTDVALSIPAGQVAIRSSTSKQACPRPPVPMPARTRPPGSGRNMTASSSTSDRAVAFYYPWYGNPATDGRYANWNHPVAVRDEPPRSYPGGEDIGSNFYPKLGCYSVNDPTVLREHMRLLRQASVGVLCASCCGKGTFTDKALPALFQAAEQAGLLIDFHIEPFPGRMRPAHATLFPIWSADSARRRPPPPPQPWEQAVFFVYDSFLTPSGEWATVLRKDGTNSIRGSEADGVVIGLWVKQDEERFMLESGFDGFYTYFATTVSPSSNHQPLARAGRLVRSHHKLFVPCVAPSYIDTRIRPWNGVNTRSRRGAGL